MPTNPIPESIEAFARDVGPARDEIVREMDDRADREDFPTVGPAVGGWLATLAALVDARRVFEFGSGFGYSAYWFARALPAEGEVVLTEVDADELAAAREYFERAGLADRARFVHGDAVPTAREGTEAVDVALIDNEKHRYVAAFEAIRDRLAPDAVVLADNVVAGPIDFETVRGLLSAADEGTGAPSARGDAGEAERGIVDYLTHVGGEPDWETVVLPLGEGLAVSRRVD